MGTKTGRAISGARTDIDTRTRGSWRGRWSRPRRYAVMWVEPRSRQRYSAVNVVCIGLDAGKVCFRRGVLRPSVRDMSMANAAPASVSVILLRLRVLNGRNGYTSACENNAIGSRICR